MESSWKSAINDVKPQGLCSASGTPLWAIGIIIIRLAMQIEQRVSDAGFLVVENLAVDTLLGTAFVDASVKLIAPGKQTIYTFSSSPVAMKSTV